MASQAASIPLGQGMGKSIGKGGKGGKGGKIGAKRHAKSHRNIVDNTPSCASIRRMARKGGVARMSKLIYEEVRGIEARFLENVLIDAMAYTRHARRKTVSTTDIVYALKRQGITLYGLNNDADAKSWLAQKRK